MLAGGRRRAGELRHPRRDTGALAAGGTPGVTSLGVDEGGGGGGESRLAPMTNSTPLAGSGHWKPRRGRREADAGTETAAENGQEGALTLEDAK